MTAHSLLVIEDDEGLQSQLRWSFDNYEVLVAGDRDTALSVVKKHQPPVVTLDLGLPPDPGGVSEGFATLQEILSIAPQTKIIVITGNNDMQNPVKSIGFGAYDFYQKPIEQETLSLVVDRAFRLYELEAENRKLAALHVTNPLNGVVAVSSEMHDVCRMVGRMAPTDLTTLFVGETGTGKEVLARALHGLSQRSHKRFIAVNSAAIPENLLESELFGHERGAFSGATSQVKGKFELADGGTFFLDEIGDIPMTLQPKLLRFLQERVIERVGGRQEIPVDVRIVAATHQDIPELIKEGRFREDLYYRINDAVVKIPPLRERTGDIVVLARVFLHDYAEQMRRTVTGFSDEAIAAMDACLWPGNVRELKSRVRRAIAMSSGPLIGVEDLELSSGEQVHRGLSLREIREQADRHAVCQALSESGGNVSKAAELLGITRPTLYSLLNKLDLQI